MKKLKKPSVKVKNAKYLLLYVNDECPITYTFCDKAYCVSTCPKAICKGL